MSQEIHNDDEGSGFFKITKAKPILSMFVLPKVTFNNFDIFANVGADSKC